MHDVSDLYTSPLWRDQAYIDGKWITGERHFAVKNPADGTVLANVPRLSKSDITNAITAAERALPGWSGLIASDRAALLKRWHRLILDHTETLARIMTLEQGKPLGESRAEITYAASFVEWFAEQARRIDGDVLTSFNPKSRVLVLKQPIGVTAGITPWNFPAAMITRKAAPALAAGCTMVLKPAEATPLSALALVQLAEQAGLPSGVLSIVTGARDDADQIGKILTTHEVIRKISFTGSTKIGTKLMAQAAATVKKTSLELGGNAPLIVFDDADLDLAVEGTMICKFRNAGQTCVCANRILVQDAIYDQFLDRLGQRIKALKVGNGLDEGVTTGPLINEAALAKVDRLVTQSLGQGAAALIGGHPSPAGGFYYVPSLLESVTMDMAITNEEIFGPVACLIRFTQEQDAIRIANATPYGLASYFFTRDLARSWRVAEALESGIVGVNSGIISSEIAPFGGIKQSGIGREGARYGIEEWVEMKYTLFGGIE